MKIVMATPYFSTEVGQPEYYLCRELMELGHEVWIVTSNRQYPSSLSSKNKRYTLGEDMVDGIHLSKFPKKTKILMAIVHPSQPFVNREVGPPGTEPGQL